MKKYKIFLPLLFFLLILYSTSTYASNNFSIQIRSISTNFLDENDKIVFSSDIIIYKYRVNNGRLQYRRWNDTQGKWVDNYWIDAK